ncbi:hypothetical protein GCM10025784_12630 [Citricoccus nitrophenolicus]
MEHPPGRTYSKRARSGPVPTTILGGPLPCCLRRFRQTDPRGREVPLLDRDLRDP